jgi:hypothetical protein
MSRRRLAVRVGAVLAVLVLLDVGAARLLLADDRFLGRAVAPFDPPLFSPAQFRALERVQGQVAGTVPDSGRFDPDLGWCNPVNGGSGEFRYDWAGARIARQPLARAKPDGVRRVVAVGCSMTHGEEVLALETWCGLVDDLREDVEVANLGVAAYGIDQAWLRLRRDGFRLQPDEVWLGVLPQAALRVTTRFRPLVDHWSLDVAFKPAFRMDGTGSLEALPCPARSLSDVVRLLTDQEAFLEAFGGRDPWVDAVPAAYAPRGSDWRHGLLSTRLLLTALEARGRDVRAAYDARRPVGALFAALIHGLAREVDEAGAVLRVVVLPGADDLRARADEGRGYWEPWAAELASSGVLVLDASAALAAAGPVEGLFAPHGHYSPEGNRIVAQVLAGVL